MQSQIILLSNVKQDNVAQLVQKEFEMLGIAGIKGKRIDAERPAIHKAVAEAIADYNVIMVIGGIGEENENMTVSAVWTLADIFNGLMAIPNLIALLALSGVIVAETRSYFKRLENGEIKG